jgi:DNA-directed RNA polymerase II subunit RPB1
VWDICKAKKRCDNDPPKPADGEFNPGGGSGENPLEGHGGCGNVQPVIRQQALTLWGHVETKDEDGVKTKEKKVVTPEMALNIFRRMTDDAMIDIGLNISQARPEWMIITVLPVPPPTCPPQHLHGRNRNRHAERGRFDIQARRYHPR